jgi:hypothetical protein
MFSEQPVAAAECYFADFSKKRVKMTPILPRPPIEIFNGQIDLACERNAKPFRISRSQGTKISWKFVLCGRLSAPAGGVF